ncbi:MAG TPA: lysylphosphatidylglycerol synthase domain-containing protein [Alphaproteobacteria bacterium]|nr:lysylphosphatidylglycerol synthase domain-containing protein [Alphaproteobacteria bacterium]
MTSHTLNRLTLLASLLVFLAAAYVLYRNLAHLRLADVLEHLLSLPWPRVAAALLFSAASYLVLTAYDYLALRYVGRSLPFRQVALTSFIAFAISQNVGAALISGGSVRYRIYSGLGLGALEIGEIVVFCAVTFALGVTTVGGLMLSLDPGDVALVLATPASSVRVAGAALLAVGLVYLAAPLVWHRPFVLGRYRLRLPSFASALAQIAVASVDLALSGAVVYLLLPVDAHVTYRTFLGAYVLAAAASILSHVPGGIGVFELVIVVMLPDVPKAASMAALVGFRCLYFLLPLALALLSLSLYEIARQKRELAERFRRRE